MTSQQEWDKAAHDSEASERNIHLLKLLGEEISKEELERIAEDETNQDRASAAQRLLELMGTNEIEDIRLNIGAAAADNSSVD
jgi:hypothetical protein